MTRLEGELSLSEALRRGDRAWSLVDGWTSAPVEEAYHAAGDDFLASVLGEFAFVLWDPLRRRFLAARDRLGVKPFYYRREKERWLFSSDPGDLARSAEPDEETLVRALAGDWSWSDRTFYRGVFRLPPGHCLVVDQAGLRTKPYWKFEVGPPVRYTSAEEYGAHFRELAVEAVRARLPKEGRAAIFLSGGIDSSAITRLAHRVRPGSFETFTACFDDPVCDNPEALRLVLESGRWPRHLLHPERTPREIDPDPHPRFRDIFYYPTLGFFRPLFERARAMGMTAVLTGCGGDDVLTPPALSSWQRLREHLPFPAIASARCFFPREPPAWLSPEIAAKYHVMDRVAERYHCGRLRRGTSWQKALHRRLFVWGGYPFAFEQEQLFASRFGMEYRYPLFDWRLIEYAFRIPRSQLDGSGGTKQVLRHAMEGIVPRALLFRKDPTDLTNVNRRALERHRLAWLSLLESSRLVARGYLRADGVRKLWADRNHIESQEPLFRIFALEKWIRRQEDYESKRPERERQSGDTQALPSAPPY